MSQLTVPHFVAFELMARVDFVFAVEGDRTNSSAPIQRRLCDDHASGPIWYSPRSCYFVPKKFSGDATAGCHALRSSGETHYPVCI